MYMCPWVDARVCVNILHNTLYFIYYTVHNALLDVAHVVRKFA